MANLDRPCFYAVDDVSGRLKPVSLDDYLAQEVPDILEKAQKVVRSVLRDLPPQLSLFHSVSLKVWEACPDHWDDGRRDYLARWFYVFAGELPVSAIIQHLAQQGDIIDVIDDVGHKNDVFGLRVLDAAVAVVLARPRQAALRK